MRRERWRSRAGFILATAGSAIGLGNIWRFPTVAVRSGGGAFVIVYILIVLFVGVPTMVAEMSLGKHSQRSVVSAFDRIKGGKKWWVAGGISLAASVIILSYYSVIAGWIIIYLWGSVSGQLISNDPVRLSAQFGAISENPFLSVGAHAVFMAVTILIVAWGVSKGIERANAILMPGIFVILLALLIRVWFLPGAIAGILWFLRPDLARLSLRVVLDALGQALFSLSLGMGAIVTYGSYLPHNSDVAGSAFAVAMADLTVALMAGLTIVPVLFAFGISPSDGPGLAFVSLPVVFAALPLSSLWASLFFTMLLFATLSSSVSMLEVPVSLLLERGRSRRAASLIAGLPILVLGIPSALSAGRLSNVLIGGRTFFDLMDFLSSNILLPIASLLLVVFVSWVWGAGQAAQEMGPTRRAGIKTTWLVLVKYIVPVVIVVVLLRGLAW